MRIRRRRAGVSAVDLVISLAIIAIILTIATPPLGRARDGYAVRSARDVAAAAIERARNLAVAHGTSRITIDTTAGELRLEAPPGSTAGDPVRVSRTFAVAVSVDGVTSPTVTLEFNAIGIGVMANRSIRFRRGNDEAGLSLSTYGRVRRW